jgi:hypothetical protein
MNDERDKQSIDDLVSAAYREHSSERTPEHLNRKILEMAAHGAERSGNIRPMFGTWTRPLALAATIALSFAIVLEVTRLPENIASPAAPAVPAGPSLREEFTPKDESAVDAARDQARLRDGSNRDDRLVAEPQAAIELEKRQNEVVADTPAEVSAAAIVAEAESVAKSVDAPDSDSPVRSRRALQSEADSANSAGRETATGQASAAFSMAEEKEASDTETGCDANERANAASWLTCIEELSRSGAVSQAEKEFEEYILKYPVE